MSLSLNLGQKSGTDLSNSLLPEQTNLSDWLTQPTTDGKTLVNVKGTDTTLTGINSLSFDGNDDYVDLVSIPSEITTTGVFDIEFDILFDSSATNIQRVFYFATSGTGFVRLQKNNSATSYILWALNSSSNNIFKSGSISYTADTVFKLKITGDGTNVVVKHDDTTKETISISTGNFETLTYSDIKLSGSGSSFSFKGKMANFKMTGGTTLHTSLPLAEGSGTKAFDISGNGNHATITGASYSTLNSIASHNHQYGFTGNSLLKVPILINKTKQAITLDGSNDVIGFGSTISVTDFVYTSKFKLETTAGNNNVFFSSGSDTSSAMFMTLDGSRLAFQIGGNLIQNFPDGSGDGSDSAQRFIVAGYTTSASQTGTVNLRDGNVHTVVLTRSGTTIAVDIDDGTATGTFINMPTDAMTFTQFGKQMTAGAYVKGTIYSSKLESGGSVVHEFNLEENIGTTTIKDSSTNSNDGTLSNATLSSAWGQRIVDSSGTIVPACYASGATEITNPSGYVHNGSECSFDLVTSDLTTANRNVIVNSTATRDFLKRDNSKQGYTPNGSSESVFFDHTLNSSSDWQAESEFIVGETTSTQQTVFSATGTTNNDYGFMLRYEDSAERWRLRLADTTSFFITKPNLELGDFYKVTLSYFSSTNKCTLVVEKNGIAETFVDNQSISNTPDFNGEAALGRLRWSGSFGGWTYKSMKFTQGTTTNVELDIANSAGLSTIADLSGNGHNGTLQNATLANSWASGNLAKQLLQYTGNLSDAGELARTRAYVG